LLRANENAGCARQFAGNGHIWSALFNRSSVFNSLHAFFRAMITVKERERGAVFLRGGPTISLLFE